MRKTFIIAEVGQAHDGSLGILHSYIDALANTGINAIKFQVHIAEAESSKFEPFRVNFSYQDKSRYDYWKRMEFSIDQWIEIKQHCDEVGLEFIASPFSNMAVDLLEKIGVSTYKIGSGEVSNFLLLEKIARTKKPIIISSGMSSFKELDNTVHYLKERNVNFSVMQCTTSYPTEPKQYGLNVIKELKDRYEVKVGFSDHSAKIETCIAAVTLGAELIEFHVVFNRAMFGPDSSSSLTIEETKMLVESVRNIEEALNYKFDKNSNETFKTLKNMFEKTLTVNKDLKVNHILTFEDLDAKKPKGYGIDACYFQKIIGKKIRRNIKKWDFLTENDIF